MNFEEQITGGMKEKCIQNWIIFPVIFLATVENFGKMTIFPIHELAGNSNDLTL